MLPPLALALVSRAAVAVSLQPDASSSHAVRRAAGWAGGTVGAVLIGVVVLAALVYIVFYSRRGR